MKNIYLITIVLIILLNNYVNSQSIKCSIDDPNSCKSVKNLYNKNYNETFVCGHLDTIKDTICIPKSMATCESDEDCKGMDYKRINKDFSFCYVNPQYNVTTKQCFTKHSENGYCLDNNHCQPKYMCIKNQCHLANEETISSILKFKRSFNSDMLIISLCIIIPLVFVCLVVSCVVYAKKYYEKHELKNSQITNISSFNSMNYNSRNIMYSRSTNTNNGSIIHGSGLNYEFYNGDPYHSHSSSNTKSSNSNSNNNNNNNNNKNDNNNNNYNKMNYDNGNDNDIKFNQQLLMTKNYRLQGYGTNSLPRSITSSPILYGYSGNSRKEDEIITGNGEMKLNHSSLNSSTGHSRHSSLPRFSSLPRQPPRSYTSNNRPKIDDINLNYNIKMNTPRKEKRISVSPPLKDWNETYNTVDSDSNSENETKHKTKDDSNNKPETPKTYDNEQLYHDYLMALSPNFNKKNNQNDDYKSDSEDITLKNMSFSSTSSKTLVQDKQLYNNIVYIQEKPSYYSRKYRENI